jgi:hypothetical protein
MFEKGQSGNPGGRQKNKIWTSAIERALQRRKGKVDLLAIDEAVRRIRSIAL